MRLTQHQNKRRKGMILILVLSILTLFSIIGVSFVLVSDSLAASAKIAREAEAGNQPDMDPEMAFSFFLGQLIYGVNDDESGVWSAMRGHSLGRDAFGWRSEPNSLNTLPFSGTGRLQYPHTATAIAGVPNHLLVNYTYFPQDGFLRDPERLGTRPSLSAARGAFVGEGNPSYTYPDHNHMFLAAVRASDGRVLTPSFHRAHLFNPSHSLNDPNNPNWGTPANPNPVGKYLTLRPRPIDHSPDLPMPTDATGDVKNWPWAPGGNDSIWIDIGAPVLTSPDGRKFKALFAPLIIDLDNRLNLNIHGNILGQGNSHRSNQGWGLWEVNLFRALDARDRTNIFLGSSTGGTVRTLGRYGPDGVPGRNGNNAVPGTSPRAWGRVDFDGANETTGGPGNRQPTNRILLPGQAPAVPYQMFPTFPPGYGDGSNAERASHPSIYNLVRPRGTDPLNPLDDRRLPLSHLVSLLRYGDTGGPSLSSDLLKLAPFSFANAKRRRLVTTDSYDLDMPGLTPYIWDTEDATDTNRYRLTRVPLPFSAIAQYPHGGPLSFPLTQTRATTPAGARSEFDAATWRSKIAALGRFDLNRGLTDYPNPNPVTQLIDHTDPLFAAAERDRRELARELYDRLRLATGAVAPTSVLAAPGTPEFEALRWLAQLAVNMVDFIDEDHYNTLFTTTIGGAGQAFYGTEMPRLLINEVYAQLDNRDRDPGIIPVVNPPGGVQPPRMATQGYDVNVWVELFNPMVAEPTRNPPETNAALLEVGGQPVYQLVVAAYDDPTEALRVQEDPNNVRGNPSAGGITPNQVRTMRNLASPALKSVLALPPTNQFSGTASANVGFYGLAPDIVFHTPAGNANVPFPSNPNIPFSHRSTELSYPIPLENTLNPIQFRALQQPTLLLRRLANPNLPHNPPAGNPQHNPNLPFVNQFITVDVARSIDSNDGRYFDARGRNGLIVPMANRTARGRRQPFAARQRNTAQNPAFQVAGQPKHTFYQHNYEQNTPPAAGAASATLKIPFDWLVHLDRQVVSPVELFNVSAFRPHLLTEYFEHNAGPTAGNVTAPHEHRARWLEPRTRLYRFLELVQAKPREQGIEAGGPVPGRININTLFGDPNNPTHFNPEVFRALCDAQPSNTFTQAQVDEIFRQLLSRRSPNVAPGPNDRPFWGLGMGAAPGGDELSTRPRGLDDTILAPFAAGSNNPLSTRLLEPFNPTTGNAVHQHPYRRYELLNKIFNRITTRSNVYAVWLTVGFFEVVDDTTRPVRLGAEIGSLENRQIRHRMFAIIDRTRMEAMTGIRLTQAVTVPRDRYSVLSNVSGTGTDRRTGRPWSVRSGTMLTVEPGTTNEETVIVRNIGGNLQAQFRKSHRAGAPAIARGNPGPWIRYDPREDSCIRYFAIID